MENLTQRLIILDIITIKRKNYRKVIKVKANKISYGFMTEEKIERVRETNKEKIVKHMALVREIQQLNSDS